MSKEKNSAQKQKVLLLGILAVVLVVLLFIYIFVPAFSHGTPDVRRVVCRANLHKIGMAIKQYASDNDNKYPTVDKWCDLLMGHRELIEKQFVCPSVREGRCHYAMNPNCEPNSPGDVVLLFETKGGWNQFGGPEILTFENHKGKGCNVLFNSGHVEFVKPEQVSKLKWKAE
jgi:competence protein ComGC